MNEFFTWTMLATYAGATLATTLITQIIKGIGFLKDVPTRATAYAVALIVLVVATVFTGEVTVSSIALCVVNAVVVSLAANGGYDAVSGKKTE